MMGAEAATGFDKLLSQHSEQALGHAIQDDNDSRSWEQLHQSMEEVCCPKRSLIERDIQGSEFVPLTTGKASSVREIIYLAKSGDSLEMTSICCTRFHAVSKVRSGHNAVQ